MKWCSALSESPHSGTAVHEACVRIEAELGSQGPDLVVLFASPHHAGSYAEIVELVLAELPEATVVGCSGGGIVGAAREVESTPALSLTAARLPGVKLRVHHLAATDIPKRDDAAAWLALGEIAAAGP